MQGIKKAGYETATPIQEAAIPAALRGRDLIGTAMTGTGKTAAFVLPILNKLLTGQHNVPRALIVTPTRELAEQINDVIRVLSAGTKIKSATIYGGVGAGPQVTALRNGAEILVACPGRLLDLVNQRIAKMEHIEILVLDEADRMFDMGFLPDVRRIIKAVPTQRQTMMFSATFPSEVDLLAASALKQPQKIAMGISRPAYTVTHALYPVARTFEVSAAARTAQTNRHEFGIDLHTHKISRTKSGATDSARRIQGHQPAWRSNAGTASIRAQRIQIRGA